MISPNSSYLIEFEIFRMFSFSGQHVKEERFALGLPEDVLRLQFIDDDTYLVMLWSGDVDLEDTRCPSGHYVFVGSNSETFCGQSYECSTIVIYDSRVLPLKAGMTLGW